MKRPPIDSFPRTSAALLMTGSLLSACSTSNEALPAEPTTEYRQENIDEFANLKAQELAKLVIEDVLEGDYVDERRSQQITFYPSEQGLGNRVSVEEQTFRPDSGEVVVCYSMVEVPADELWPFDPNEVTGIFLSRDVVPEDMIDTLPRGTNSSFGLYDLEYGWRMITRHDGVTGAFYNTNPKPDTIEELLPIESLKSEVAQAESIIRCSDH